MVPPWISGFAGCIVTPQDKRNNSVNSYGFCKLLQFLCGFAYGFANFDSIQDNGSLRIKVLTNILKKHITYYPALPIWVCGAILIHQITHFV